MHSLLLACLSCPKTSGAGSRGNGKGNDRARGPHEETAALRKSEKPLLGSFTDAQWQGVIKSLKLGGVIAKTDLPMDKLYTNQFVADFNKFDRADVIKRAKAATK